jgi:hypothetical protein
MCETEKEKIKIKVYTWLVKTFKDLKDAGVEEQVLFDFLDSFYLSVSKYLMFTAEEIEEDELKVKQSESNGEWSNDYIKHRVEDGSENYAFYSIDWDIEETGFQDIKNSGLMCLL